MSACQQVMIAQNIAASATFTIQTSNTATDTDGSVDVALSGVTAGARLVVTFASEKDNGTLAVSGGGLTWTLRTNVTASNCCRVCIGTAEFAAGGSITITASNTVSGDCSVAAYAVTGVETTAGGANGTASSQNTVDITITTTQTSSKLFCVSGDWDAVATTPAYGSPPAITQKLNHATGNYHGFHYYADDAGAIATKHITASAPISSTSLNSAAYEIRAP